MYMQIHLAVAIGVALFPAVAAAQSAAPASTQQCRVCHALDGTGTNPMIPNIGGQSAEYLVKQLQDFRAGRREDPQMTIIAESLSDDEIRELASWFASVEASFTLPE